MELSVGLLRSFFRSLVLWRDIHATYGLDSITDSAGQEWSLEDIEYLFECCKMLPKRQYEAIVRVYYYNQREKDAAVGMNVKPTVPIGSYASDGLEKLLCMINEGKLPRFNPLLKETA